MFTGTDEEFRKARRRTRQLTEEVVNLLNQIGDLGLGSVQGNLFIPEMDVRHNGIKWCIR